MTIQLPVCTRVQYKFFRLCTTLHAFAFLSLGVTPALANDPPVVIVTGVSEGDTISYRSTLGWIGADPDGTIDHFEVALDPPAEFTPEEIASPETGESVTIEVIAGPGENEDTLRVSKSVPGGTVTFDYVQTPAGSMAFVFSTPYADSTDSQYDRLPDSTFSGAHELFVRARDDLGAYGAPSRVGFTARTLAPTSVIDLPRIAAASFPIFGTWIRFEWSGQDPDASDSRPVGYYYKLLDPGTLPPILLHYDAWTLMSYGGPWTYVDGDTNSVEFNLDDRHSYAFAVRAVDENGATEPFLEFHRNVFTFQAIQGSGPTLTLSHPDLGSFVFSKPGEILASHLPGDLDHSFAVTCIGPGIDCFAYRWGIDLADPDSEEGWSPWTAFTSSSTSLPPIQFAGRSVHDLFVEAEDEFHRISRGHLVLTAVPMSFDRDVLYVDDYRDGTWPRDSRPMVNNATGDTLAPSHDGFWRNLFDGYGKIPLSSFYEFHAFGNDDTEFTIPVAPTLDELGRYKLVIWNVQGGGYDGHTALSASVPAILGSYLAAGGNLWLSGRLTVGAMTWGGNGRGEFTYPKDIKPESFAGDHLKLLTEKLDNDKGWEFRHTLSEVVPTNTAPGFSRMTVDWTKLNPALAKRGVSHCDAVFDPLFPVSGVREELYVYGAYGASSKFQGKLCAIRWHDDALPPSEGKVLWFGFPMYHLRDEEAQDTFNKALDWFFESNVPVRLSAFRVQREAGDAVVRWSVAEARDHAGFHVYRQLPAEERIRLTEGLLAGHNDYTFRDLDAPRSAADYWLAELSRAGETSWHGPVTLAAEGSARWLLTASPNPFASETRIRYSLGASGPVRITVLDVGGRFVATLTQQVQEPGEHEVAWDGRLASGEPVRSGLYFIRSEIGGERRAIKVILNR